MHFATAPTTYVLVAYPHCCVLLEFLYTGEEVKVVQLLIPALLAGC
jgi:hypothetical protein